jgi:hypothetical protein
LPYGKRIANAPAILVAQLIGILDHVCLKPLRQQSSILKMEFARVGIANMLTAAQAFDRSSI